VSVEGGQSRCRDKRGKGEGEVKDMGGDGDAKKGEEHTRRSERDTEMRPGGGAESTQST
jgi:hypothetical protein